MFGALYDILFYEYYISTRLYYIPSLLQLAQPKKELHKPIYVLILKKPEKCCLIKSFIQNYSEI